MRLQQAPAVDRVVAGRAEVAGELAQALALRLPYRDAARLAPGLPPPPPSPRSSWGANVGLIVGAAGAKVDSVCAPVDVPATGAECVVGGDNGDG